MWKAQIKSGGEYAIREKRGAPFQRVRILEHVRRNKWKAEWIEPNPGLIDFVESGHIACPWKDLKALIREEQARARMLEHNDACGYEYESAVDKALHSVFECTGDRVNYDRGVLSGSAEPFERVKTRAGLAQVPDSPYAYVDRSGVLHLPYDQTVELARRFCAAEPGTVLLDVEKTEREWTREAQIPGEGSIVGLLNEYRAAFALIRQWAGYDAAVAQREEHIRRLERLVWDAVYALQKAGLDREAERLRRALGRG